MNLLRIPVLIICLAVLVLLSSCTGERGCTDKNALNYNAAAKSDDGSCRYCNSKATHSETVSRDLSYSFYYKGVYDQYFVVNVRVSQTSIIYNSQKCNNGEGSICYLKVNLKNIFPEKEKFDLRINSGSYSYYNSFILEPNESIEIDSIPSSSFSACPNVDASFLMNYVDLQNFSIN